MRRFDSLAAQFLILILVIVSSSMSINVYLQYKNELQVINKALYARGQSIGELLASISVEPLLLFDDVTLDGHAKFTSKQKDIVFAAVVNKQKIPLTHYLNYENDYIKLVRSNANSVDIKPVLEKVRVNPDILFFETPRC